MYDELTQVDIDKMKEEIAHRTKVLRPQLIEEVRRTREFGDLSENFEYKCAKRDKNRNDSRIRYLERMIKTAKVIDAKPDEEGIGLFDKVTVFNEMTGKKMELQIVTTLRQNVLKGLITRESPVGKALVGHKAGDRVQVVVSPQMQYFVEILTVEKGEDDDTMEIGSF